MATGVASWSQTAATNAAADSNVNMAEGMAPSQVNDGVRALMASVARYRDDLSGITTGGSSTAYTVTTSQGFASLAALDTRAITIVPHASSGAAPTLSVDGLTAKPIRLMTGVAPPTATFVLGSPVTVVYSAANNEFVAFAASTAIPPGIVVPFAGAAAPGGWHLCCAQAVSRATYAGLFAVIGTTFGVGDGASTFNLPDLRGRVIAGLDGVGGFGTAARITVAGGNFDGTVLGGSGGAQNHTLATSELPAHHHGVFLHDPGHFHTYIPPAAENGAPGGSVAKIGTSTNTSTNTTGITVQSAADSGGVAQGVANQTADSTGGGTAMPVLPPALVLNHIIKF